MAKVNQAFQNLEGLSDEQLIRLQFSAPWNYSPDTGGYKDADGFVTDAKDSVTWNRDELQRLCWDKFNKSPHVNTAVRGLVGRLTGDGFSVTSEVPEIQEAIEEVELDPRNRLYNFMPKFVGRAFIEGELFHCVTVHPDGFVEIDFIDPSVITGGAGIKKGLSGGDEDDGIYYHPSKPFMPLIYNIVDGAGRTEQIPSIFMARFPELWDTAYNILGVSKRDLGNSRSRKKSYQNLGGYYRFVIAWDRSFLTRRNISYLRTIIEWLNYYEQLKKYEIDHKKSSGAYLWVITIEDPKAFRVWLSLSEDEKRKTGIAAKKTPGGTIVLPPGMKLECKNPQLPRISDTDTDILHMVTGGLNEPEDVSTGQSKGTFASVKASRGPMSDRIADEVAYFERYLKYDFWGSVFFLRSAVSAFPSLFKRRVAVDFKDQEPVFKNVVKRPEQLITVSFPVSEVIDAEARARAYLGVKHGSTYDTLGIPNAVISKKLGFADYRKMRLEQATEMENYPETILTLDQEQAQEAAQAEPKPKLKKAKAAAAQEGKKE